MILTPGSKKRVLYLLDQLEVSVRMDQDRETLMHQAMQVLPALVNQFAYMEAPKPTKRKRPTTMEDPAPRKRTRIPHRCDGIIDPNDTNRNGKMPQHDW